MCALSPLPMVSVIIPFLNASRYIEGSLRAIQEQSYPANLVEIIAVDGGSSDESLEVVTRMAASDRRIRIASNPLRNAAAGMNVGISLAQGEILVRVDAHCIIERDYIERCVQYLMTNPRIGAVGGRFTPRGETRFGHAIAEALMSPFSMGGSPFRYARVPRRVDTVYLGAYRRRELEAIGRFDASLGANEDYELNYRLRRAGFDIWCDPAIQSHTFTRGSASALALQYSRYGFWKARVIAWHPASTQVRHFIPPLYMLALMGAGLIGLATNQWWPAGGLILCYSALNLGATAHLGITRRSKSLWLIPLAFAIMHMCWGAGLLAGSGPAILSAIRRRKTRRSPPSSD